SVMRRPHVRTGETNQGKPPDHPTRSGCRRIEVEALGLQEEEAFTSQVDKAQVGEICVVLVLGGQDVDSDGRL
ncbi:hypothetical protein, partial [Streptomyces antibioticus]|uniref:hypothetical protein n=1 Tax=Streptomyces antibioticus TaxID=1890 RepID=UPI00340164DD